MSDISVKWKRNGQFRRFSIRRLSDAVQTYAELIAKIIAVEPQFNDTLAWRDCDGDLIVFTSATEFMLALNNLKAHEPLRIFSVPGPKSKESNEEPKKRSTQEEELYEPKFGSIIHPNVVCDNCDGNVVGIRYKCLGCHDYDLCINCEKLGIHTHHPMARIIDPKDNLFKKHHTWFQHLENSLNGPAGHAQQHLLQHLAALNNMYNCFPLPNEQTEANIKSRATTYVGIDTLKDIGATIAVALAKFGIKVEIDSENDGQEEKVTQKETKKKCGGMKNASHPFGIKVEIDSENDGQEEKVTQEETKKKCGGMKNASHPFGFRFPFGKFVDAIYKAAQEDLLEQCEKYDDDKATGGATDETCEAKGKENCEKNEEKSENGVQTPTSLDWTIVDGNEEENKAEGQKLYPDVTNTPHPDPVVNNTLNDLRSMGYNVDEEWLQSLVEGKRGDINAVLNTLLTHQ